MLQIILVAQYPLDVNGISVALAASPGLLTLQDVSLEIKYPREGYVKALCGHFVRIIQGKVHQTAREFLLHDTQSSAYGDKWQHTISLPESHRSMLRACISYMSCGERSQWDPALSLGERNSVETDLSNPEREESPTDSVSGDGTPTPAETEYFVELSRRHPFFKYAASYWTTHFARSELTPDMELFTQVIEFCQPLDEHAGYPVWTLARPEFSNFGSNYWNSCRNSSDRFSRYANIIFGLEIESIHRRFMEQHRLRITEEGEALFHIATQMKSLLGCKCLFENGSNINVLNRRSQTPLDLACKLCVLDIVAFLVARGAKPSETETEAFFCTVHCRTTLHCAVDFGKLDLTKLLIETGSSLEAQDSSGRLPIPLAIEANHNDIISIFDGYNYGV